MKCKFCNTTNAPFRVEGFVGKNRYVCDDCFADHYFLNSKKKAKPGDARIDWHIKRNPNLSPLAVRLALAASERGNDDAAYEWEARNAQRFQTILNAETRTEQPVAKSLKAVLREIVKE